MHPPAACIRAITKSNMERSQYGNSQHGNMDRSLRPAHSESALPKIRINASSPRRMKSMKASKSSSALPPLSQRTSTPAAPHVYGDNHSIFGEKWGSPKLRAKPNELRDPSFASNWGHLTAPRCFEDALLGNARRERVEVHLGRAERWLGVPSPSL